MATIKLKSEASRRMELALAKRLGLNPNQVLHGISVESTGGPQVRVSWTGTDTISLVEFNELFSQAQKEA